MQHVTPLEVASAVQAAERYLAQWSLRCRSAQVTRVDNEPLITDAEARTLRSKLRRLLRRFRITHHAVPGFTVEVDTAEGRAWVYMSRALDVKQLHWTPCEPGGLLLPLWAVFPTFTSVTIWWRMTSGEAYLAKWDAWYHALPEADRMKYQERFPAPTDPERAWEGWYAMADYRPTR